MPETRVIQTVYGIGGYDPTKPNKNIIEEVTAVISDEQLAEEAEAKEVQLIIERLPNTGINKAWKRLISKGLLP